MNGAKTDMLVTEIGHRTTQEDDGLAMWRRFRVTRSSRPEHIVEVEVTLDGTPQNDRCDCPGFRYRRECAHVTAVYESGSLGHALD